MRHGNRASSVASTAHFWLNPIAITLFTIFSALLFFPASAHAEDQPALVYEGAKIILIDPANPKQNTYQYEPKNRNGAVYLSEKPIFWLKAKPENSSDDSPVEKSGGVLAGDSLNQPEKVRLSPLRTPPGVTPDKPKPPIVIVNPPPPPWKPPVDPPPPPPYVPQAPVAYSGEFSVKMDQELVIPLSVTDSDTSPDLLSYLPVSSPEHGVFKKKDKNQWTYQPNSGFIGTDSFSFKVRDNTSLDSNTALVNIKVVKDLPTPPQAVIQASKTTVDEGEAVVLNGSTSTGTGITYSWSQTSGAGLQLRPVPEVAIVRFTAPQGPDTLIFQLEVKDSEGQTSQAQVTVVVNPLVVINHPPVADAGEDITVKPNDPVVLNGDGSDQDGDLLTYAWKQNESDPVIVGADFMSAQNITFTAPSVETILHFTLKVTDEHNESNEDEVVVTVQNPPSHIPTVYYVDNPGDGIGADGSDSNDGLTLLTAFATIQHGVDQLLAGDTLMIRGGTYTNPDPMGIVYVAFRKDLCGEPGKEITIRNYNNDRVIIDGENTKGGIYFLNSRYINIEGLEVVNVYIQGIGFTNVDHGRIVRNYVHDVRWESGIQATGTANMIKNNVVAHSPTAFGFNLAYLSDSVVEENVAYENTDGFFIVGNTGTNIIRNNIAYSNSGNGFYLLRTQGSSFGSFYFNNVAYHNSVGFFATGTFTSPNIFKNNIAYLNTTQDTDFSGTVNIQMDHNMNFPDGYLSGDPGFVSPSDPGVVLDLTSPNFAEAPGFKLKTGSPAINAGVEITYQDPVTNQSVTIPHYGSAPDLGAYEYTGNHVPVDYYVATTGSDTYTDLGPGEMAGDINHPFQTIQKGLDALKVSDTLFIRGGTYSGEGNVNLTTPSGEAGKEITIKNHEGESVEIGGGFRIITLNPYTILEGVTVKDAKACGHAGQCVNIITTSHNIIRHVTSRGTNGSGINVGAYNLIEYSHIFNNRSGINLGFHSSIRNNLIHDNLTEGIVGGAFNLYDSNLIYGNGRGIEISTIAASFGSVYKNNTIFGNKTGIKIDMNESSNPANLFLNNTVYQPLVASKALDIVNTVSNNIPPVFRNNIFQGQVYIDIVRPPVLDSDYNLWSPGEKPSQDGPQSRQDIIPDFPSPSNPFPYLPEQTNDPSYGLAPGLVPQTPITGTAYTYTDPTSGEEVTAPDVMGAMQSN